MRIKIVRRLLFPLLALLLACGPMFYVAPPTLEKYPERVVTRSWHEIFAEVAPPANLATSAQLDQTCQELPGKLEPLEVPARLAEIDRLLEENRSGPYQAERANFLHEIRELAADSTVFEQAAEYLKERLQRKPLPNRPIRHWNLTDEEFAKLERTYQQQVAELLRAMQQLVSNAPPALQPHYQVQLGALYFQLRLYDEAAAVFHRVVATFPDHPRAEAARLMEARSHLERSRELRRVPGSDLTEVYDELNLCEEELQEIVRHFPTGRFTPDAHGWLGAVAVDRQQYGLAVAHQLDRLSQQPTREIIRSVLRECDAIFTQTLSMDGDAARFRNGFNPDDFAAEAIAKHPMVVRLFLQHVLDPGSGMTKSDFWFMSDDHPRIEFLENRIFTQSDFIADALQHLGDELLKQAQPFTPTTLSLLAWSATESGEHSQAIALLDRIPEASRHDELLQLRAIVLQRLKRHADAVAELDLLKQKFPGSPLVQGIEWRRIDSLCRLNRADEALVSLFKLNASTEFSPDGLHSQDQSLQWLDTLLQFAPIHDLEKALAQLDPDNRWADPLRTILRCRALVAGNFDLARRYPAENADEVERLEKLAGLGEALARADSSAEQARLHLEIARQWLDGRGRLTMPALSITRYAGSEVEKQEMLRRRNARNLGFPVESVQPELDGRDEATHALRHALAAAESNDAAIAAPALELAQQCLFMRAEFSKYGRARALENRESQQSAELQEELRQRFPASKEAERAVRFQFSPPVGPWMPGNRSHHIAVDDLVAAATGEPSKFSNWNWYSSDAPASQAVESIRQRVADLLAVPPDTDWAQVRKNLELAIDSLPNLRRQAGPWNHETILSSMNQLADLAAAAKVPGITTADFLAYGNRHFDKLPPSFESLIAYRRIIDSPDQDATVVIQRWRDFLQKWPDSPKAEAASFLLTRTIARQSRGRLRIAGYPFPEAPILEGYKHVVVSREAAAVDPVQVLAAIDEHEARFPSGMYHNDLELLKAGALIDRTQFGEALEILLKILNDPVQTDLHHEAALNFADLAQRLLIPEQRAPAIAAFRKIPGATDRLRQVVAGQTFLHRLEPLMPFIINPS